MSDQMSGLPVDEQLGPPPVLQSIMDYPSVAIKNEFNNEFNRQNECPLLKIDDHLINQSINLLEDQYTQQQQLQQTHEQHNEVQSLGEHDSHQQQQQQHEEQESQEEQEEHHLPEHNDEHNDINEEEEEDDNDDEEEEEDNEEHEENVENKEQEEHEEPEQMVYEMDVNLLKEENTKLSEEVQFAQNIVKLLENYRNLIIVCLNNCQNCAQNQVLIQEFNELEQTYDKDLSYAKDIVFDKNFYNKINRIFNKKKKNSNERKYDIIDDYIESDSDEKISLDQDSEYEPNEEQLLAEPEEKPKKRQKRTPKPRKPKTVRKRTKKTRSYDLIEEEIDEIIEQLGSNPDEEVDDSAWNPNQTAKPRKTKGRGRPKGSTPKVIKVKGPKKRYDKVYKCDFCEYTHRKPPNLEAHKNKVHLNIRPYKCDKCEKSFTGKPFLDKHRRFHNESDSSYHYCNWTDCKFRTKYMNNLKEHRLRHERDRQFRCAWPGCGQSFYNNRDMTQHMKSHEDQRTYRCDWPGCESTFKRHTYLSRHKRLHINSDDAFPCVWPGCGKAFNTKKKLANHSTLHKKQLEENVQQMVRNIPPPIVDPKQMAKRSVIQNQSVVTNRAIQNMSVPNRMANVPTLNVPKVDNRLPAHTNQIQLQNMASAQQFARTVVQSALGSVNSQTCDTTPTPTDLSQHRPTGYNTWSLNNLNNFYH